MPRQKRYLIERNCGGEWFPSFNFDHRKSGPTFKTRAAAQRGLKKYCSKGIKYRIVPYAKGESK